MASKIIPKDLASKASKLVPSDPAGAAKSFLRKALAPWSVTGPTATPEFLESVPDAADYRKIAPATVTVRPVVPHAEPALVFDIKYHTRDRKRGVKTTVEEVDPVAMAQEMQTAGGGTQYVMGRAFHMDDEPGEGYQK